MKLKIIAFLFVCLAAVFLFGNYPDYPDFNGKIEPCSVPIEELDDFIAQKEAKVTDLRPNNQAQIIWKDSIQKTEWAIVFLHGFSASPQAGNPIVNELAQQLNANVYLARLHDHGRKSDETFVDLTPKELIDSAKEAIAIGNQIGEKVLVLGSSTGCTLGLYAAAHNPEMIDALMLFSPNIALASKTAFVARMPFGLELMRWSFGSNYRSFEMKEKATPFWTTTYRLEGLQAMIYLLHETMTPATFEKVKQPTMVAVYYKNEKEKDTIISVEAAQKMFDALGTPENEKRMNRLASVGGHVMLSKYQTSDLVDVRIKTRQFGQKILNDL